jgi:hypothetical protein
MTEDAYEWAHDRAEAEYFAQGEKGPATHNYPQSSIVSSNELDLTGVPF